ncbi:hypothetical protein H9I45_11935 [Polaribacter haliotis]|uniref:Uncharacterized protein n=1 Tax=Polaribacter haliotis TaxID=1888915 RepID=A0A7L8ADW1_9FLAO|nr:hypothetical protein [Polaribacter haliotis]QOD60049.1 hypothetical protein H9I45_11935 [Polaribacter haliotis]
MKKPLLTLALFLCCQIFYSQVYVEDKNINDLKDVKYIELVGVNTSLFGVKMKVFVDYGAEVKFLKNQKIKDAEGNVKKFNTMIAALNFMYNNGWEFVNYNLTFMGKKATYIYLLKKAEK